MSIKSPPFKCDERCREDDISEPNSARTRTDDTQKDHLALLLALYANLHSDSSSTSSLSQYLYRIFLHGHHLHCELKEIYSIQEFMLKCLTPQRGGGFSTNNSAIIMPATRKLQLPKH